MHLNLAILLKISFVNVLFFQIRLKYQEKYGNMHVISFDLKNVKWLYDGIDTHTHILFMQNDKICRETGLNHAQRNKILLQCIFHLNE